MKVQQSTNANKVTEKLSTVQLDAFDLSLTFFIPPRQDVSKTEVACAIFHTHETSGTWAAM